MEACELLRRLSRQTFDRGSHVGRVVACLAGTEDVLEMDVFFLIKSS